MRVLILLAIVAAGAGCRSQISQSEAIATLAAQADGSVVACVIQTRIYENGFADCCQDDESFATLRLDAGGEPHDRADANGCPGAVAGFVPPPASFRIALPDGGALVVHNSSGGDISAVDAAGNARWSTSVGFGVAPSLTALAAEVAFVSSGAEVDELDLRDGAITWSATVEAF